MCYQAQMKTNMNPRHNNFHTSADCTVLCTVHLLYKMIQNYLKLCLMSAYEWSSRVHGSSCYTMFLVCFKVKMYANHTEIWWFPTPLLQFNTITKPCQAPVQLSFNINKQGRTGTCQSADTDSKSQSNINFEKRETSGSTPLWLVSSKKMNKADQSYPGMLLISH